MPKNNDEGLFLEKKSCPVFLLPSMKPCEHKQPAAFGVVVSVYHRSDVIFKMFKHWPESQQRKVASCDKENYSLKRKPACSLRLRLTLVAVPTRLEVMCGGPNRLELILICFDLLIFNVKQAR